MCGSCQMSPRHEHVIVLVIEFIYFGEIVFEWFWDVPSVVDLLDKPWLNFANQLHFSQTWLSWVAEDPKRTASKRPRSREALGNTAGSEGVGDMSHSWWWGSCNLSLHFQEKWQVRIKCELICQSIEMSLVSDIPASQLFPDCRSPLELCMMW